ncbi:hypothetical protein LSM04_001696 [Trypanosoma melophagium]|uniref:uncharacterized protein n=1 Tax=Trypanosoma melophagium TaxID=715481 RepID=UPI00351AA25D|nr:hypothetical protein LSM04_001696 [Trypanosoma melophagium]
MNNAWTPFIYQVFGHSNLHVGLMSALNGVFELIFALIGGYLADKVVGPSQTLLISARMGILALLSIIVSVWCGNWWLLIRSQSLFGCIRQGERDHLYGVKFSLEDSAPIGGLVLSLVLFAPFGNTWRVDVLRWVITAGVLLHIASMQTRLSRFKPLPSHLDKVFDSTHLQPGETSSTNPCNREEPRVLYIEEEIINYEKKEKKVGPLPPLEKEDEIRKLEKILPLFSLIIMRRVKLQKYITI